MIGCRMKDKRDVKDSGRSRMPRRRRLTGEATPPRAGRPTLRPRLPLSAADAVPAVAPGDPGYAFLVRVAPPRPRSVTPLSLRTRCTNPYDRPVDSARARMLAPFSYFFFRSLASLSRVDPVIRAPFFRSATTNRPPPVPPRALDAALHAVHRDSGAGPPLGGTMIVDWHTPRHQSQCGSVNGSPERITQSGDQWNLSGSGTSARRNGTISAGRG